MAILSNYQGNRIIYQKLQCQEQLWASRQQNMRLTRLARFSFAKHSRYVIAGGGTGGLSIVAHLLRTGVHSKEVLVIDPSPFHYYQPGWTMVGAGQWMIHSTAQKMEETFPKNTTILRDRVKLVKPESNTLITNNGEQFTYDELVLATGLQLQYFKIEGLKEALDDPNSNVGSIYQLNYAQKMAKIAAKLNSGKAIFTEPPMPIKCAGAPQKILYLWTDQWGKKNLPIEVEFNMAKGVMFGVPKYSNTLSRVAADYNIKCHFKNNLVKVKGNEATFKNLDTGELVTKQFELLHAVPPMGPHPYIAESGLGDASGYLDVDRGTLRHTKYPNIWGIGDCTSLPCAKTAAAIFSQTEVLHDNMMATRKNPTQVSLPSVFNGYASCPLFVGKRKLMLAEFKYNGEIDQTFFNDQQNPRHMFYLMKRFMFPLAYWFFVPHGFWAGRKGIRWV